MKKNRKSLKERVNRFLDKAAKENQDAFNGKPSCCSGKPKQK